MSIKISITRRFTLIYLMMVLVGICVVIKMVFIVVKEKNDGRAIDEKLSFKTNPIQANRGNIVAHDGRLLATSVSKYRLYTDFNARGLTDSMFYKNVDSLARGLSYIFNDKTVQQYSNELKLARRQAVKDPNQRTNRYRPIVNSYVDYVTMQRVKSLPIFKNTPNKGGVRYEESVRRIHPHDNMAYHTVGWTNQNNQGVGIEYSYNKELSGKQGKEILQRASGRNAWIPVSSTPEVEPQDGYDVVCALDVDMQEMAETVIINKLLQNSDLEWGTAVIMEVKTGEIRAIANKRKVKETNAIVEDENYALRYRKDPGSTFKLASFLVMIEKGLNINDTVDTKNGYIIRYNKRFEDEGSSGGILTVQQAFEKSSNVGTIVLSERIYKEHKNRKDFAQRIDALKLKDLINFDISAQQRITPLIKSADQYSGLTLSMMSIGYELEITPLQTLALYNAIANNGTMVHPKFIKELRYQGEVVKTFPTQVVNASICSKETLKTMQGMLEGVVERGSARRARTDAFKIAGKTGTAHIAEGKKGYTNQKLSSFAGYFPADDPKYSCIVAFKTFETPNKSYGGAVAAPVFKSIAEKVYAKSIDWHKPIDTLGKTLEAPYTKSGNYAELSKVLNSLHISTEGNEEVNTEWVSTNSKNNQVVAVGRSITSNTMPNVLNMGIKDAVYILENAGLKVNFSGKGTIKEQHPAAGSNYNSGQTATLTLTYN